MTKNEIKLFIEASYWYREYQSISSEMAVDYISSHTGILLSNLEEMVIIKAIDLWIS